jgi:hypothetical protein
MLRQAVWHTCNLHRLVLHLWQRSDWGNCMLRCQQLATRNPPWTPGSQLLAPQHTVAIQLSHVADQSRVGDQRLGMREWLCQVLLGLMVCQASACDMLLVGCLERWGHCTCIVQWRVCLMAQEPDEPCWLATGYRVTRKKMCHATVTAVRCAGACMLS